jgi:uncharacterized membrane protein YfcA
MEEKKGRLFKWTVGGFVGGANSLFGGGGGMLAVPLLEKTGKRGKQAHATAILLILPISFLSFLLYFFSGEYDFSIAIPLALGSFVGGILGAKLLAVLPEKQIAIAFGILQVLSGIWMIL